jgi:hypothetical protein
MLGLKVTQTKRPDKIVVEAKNLLIEYTAEKEIRVVDIDNFFPVAFRMSCSEAKRLAEAIKIILERK